jgi:two-component system, cell cycle sensor histidine kinase and response regulator CckA
MSLSHAPVILLVDDDLNILSLGQEILECLGFQVLIAADGNKALEIYQAQKPEIDLIVLDYLLPRMDGYEILLQLRRINPQAKVIMASGFFEHAEMEKLRQAGAAGLIHKPFRAIQLEGQIKQALGVTSE